LPASTPTQALVLETLEGSTATVLSGAPVQSGEAYVALVSAVRRPDPDPDPDTDTDSE
jgi:hypothetical protein